MCGVMEGLECRRLLAAAGPDEYGYVAQSGALGAYHLTAGDPGVVTLLNGVNDAAAVVPLGANQFTIYSTSYTGNSLFVSDNGLIAFGSGVSSANNTDLNSGPAPASIAVLWDDWTTAAVGAEAGANDDAVLYKLDAPNNRLIIQWNALRRVEFESFGNVTFQAILSLNTGSAAGTIVFNYEDISIEHPVFDNGANATEGIKPAGAPPFTRLLIARDDSTSALVQTGIAATINFVPASVTGIAFRDNDGDGLFSGEAGVAGATIYADLNNNGSRQPNEPMATSSANGSYTINGLAGGTFILRQTSPAGYASAVVKQVNVPAAATLGGVNFPYVPLTFTGTGASENYLVRKDTAGLNYKVLVNNVLNATLPASLVSSLTFSLGAGDDTLTLDCVNGNPIPTGGIVYDGGGNSSNANDVLLINGSAANESIDLSNPLITLLDVEAVTIRGNGGNDQLTINSDWSVPVTFDGGSGTDALVFVGSAGPDFIEVATASIATTGNIFRVFGTERVTVNGNGGADTININSTALGQSVVVSAGDGDDQINIGAGTLDAIPGNVSVSGDAGNDSLTLNDQLLPNDDTYAFDANTFDRNFFGLLTFFSLESVTLYGADGDNEVLVTVYGGRGPEGISGVPLIINAGAGDDVITVELLQGTSELAPVGITIAGGSGDDSLTLTDRRTAKNATYGIQDGFVSASFGIGTFSLAYGTIEALALTCESGNNLITLSGTALDVPVTIAGGPGNDTLTISGAPSSDVEFDAGTSANETAVLNVNAGSYTFTTDAKLSSSNLTVNVGPGGQAIFDASQHLAALNVSGRATMAADGNLYLQTQSLILASTAKLDLNDNDLIIEYPTGSSPYLNMLQRILDGYSAAPDSSKTGILSSVSQQTGGYTILALLDNGLAGLPEWPPGSGNLLPLHTLIGKYTYLGDLNLDGQVTPQDYTSVDSNLGTTPPVGLAWPSGDSNFDGNVTPQDYSALDASLGLGIGNPLMTRSVELLPLALRSNKDLLV
jgi:hypothetical protein